MYIVSFIKLPLFLTPVLWFPFLFVLFLLLFLDNGDKEIESYEGLYIKEGLFFTWKPFWEAIEGKINPTAIDVTWLHR